MAGRRGRTALGGTVVLDADGVSKAAAADRLVHAMLLSARHRDARVVVSAVTLAEVLRGTPRDAATYRVLTRIAELPVTSEVGRAAGALLGSTGLSGATVDAVVAATALRQTGPVLLVTSDPSDMAALTASRSDLAVAAV